MSPLGQMWVSVAIVDVSWSPMASSAFSKGRHRSTCGGNNTLNAIMAPRLRYVMSCEATVARFRISRTLLWPAIAEPN